MIESESKEERAAIGETLKALGEEINEVEEMLAQVDEPAPDGPDAGDKGDNSRQLDPIATFKMRDQNRLLLKTVMIRRNTAARLWTLFAGALKFLLKCARMK